MNKILKPCPFCGEAALEVSSYIEARSGFGQHDKQTWIECSRCSATTDTAEEWNKRQPMEPEGK